MRVAILADIHGNLEAFSAVLADIQKRGPIDETWCLGDTVGYGPDPHACLEMLRGTANVCVPGNHDLAAIGKIGTEAFNADAAFAAEWTGKHLTAADTAYLGSLPLMLQKENFTLAHGSPREPVWEYILYPTTAAENFDRFATPYCLVGHSHLPLVFKQADSEVSSAAFQENVGVVLGKSRAIINPGSVGQPRDGNPLAAYAILDTEARMMRLHRVPYDIETTQNKMLHAGLPMRLVSRLSHGV